MKVSLISVINLSMLMNYVATYCPHSVCNIQPARDPLAHCNKKNKAHSKKILASNLSAIWATLLHTLASTSIIATDPLIKTRVCAPFQANGDYATTTEVSVNINYQQDTTSTIPCGLNSNENLAVLVLPDGRKIAYDKTMVI